MISHLVDGATTGDRRHLENILFLPRSKDLFTSDYLAEQRQVFPRTSIDALCNAPTRALTLETGEWSFMTKKKKEIDSALSLEISQGFSGTTGAVATNGY